MVKFDENLTKKIHTTFFYVCLYVCKPKSKKNTTIEWKIFQGCFQNKKEKRLSFITQFKIEFLLPFTSRREVFGKTGPPHAL